MNQIDWLVSRGSTLRKLYLVDCPIIHKEGLKLEGQRLHWSAVYSRLRSGLPKLIDFATCGTENITLWGIHPSLGDARHSFAPSNSSLNDMGALYWTRAGLISQELEDNLWINYNAPTGALSLWDANWRRRRPNQATWNTIVPSFYSILPHTHLPPPLVLLNTKRPCIFLPTITLSCATLWMSSREGFLRRFRFGVGARLYASETIDLLYVLDTEVSSNSSLLCSWQN